MSPILILGKSFRSIAGNLVEAVQISGLIWIGLLASQIVFRALFSPMGAVQSQVPILLNAAFAVAGSVWISVAWHRFLLSGERPMGVVPVWNASRFWGYLKTSLVVGILLTGILFAVVLVASMVGAGLAAGGQIGASMAFVSFLTGLILNFVFLRLGPLFPAVAIGEKMRLPEAWRRTKPIAGACAVLALISSLVMPLYVSLLASIGPGSLAGLIIELVLGWMILMFSVSVLTTIYSATAPKDNPNG